MFDDVNDVKQTRNRACCSDNGALVIIVGDARSHVNIRCLRRKDNARLDVVCQSMFYLLDNRIYVSRLQAISFGPIRYRTDISRLNRNSIRAAVYIVDLRQSLLFLIC
jgi:hypothetical protein